MRKIKAAAGFLILAAIGTMALTACPAPYHELDALLEEAQPIKRVFFVKGDPAELIRGAKLQPTSPITEQNIQEWNDYTLVSYYGFFEKEEILKKPDPVTQEQLEKENAAKDLTKKGDPDQYKVSVEKNESGKWQINLFSGALGFQLKMDTENRLQPELLFDKKTWVSMQVVHWSISKDEKFLSLLVRLEEDFSHGKNLIAFYFQRKKTADVKIETTNEKYIYLAGAGKKIGWQIPLENNLEVKLCGSFERNEQIKKAVESWNQHLMGRLSLKYKQTNDFAPFSDLNQHCVYFVDAYFYEARMDAATYGATPSVLSITDAKIVDSDVFMFNAEFEKMYKLAMENGYTKETATNYSYGKLSYAVTHELGHLLGLHHKFDKTPSIMSYAFAVSEPQQYDIETIQELYPLTKKAEVKK